MTRYQPQWLQSGSYAASVDRRLIGALWPNPASSGGALTVNAGTMTMSIAPGQCAVPSGNGTGSSLCSWDGSEQVSITTAPGATGQNRIDLITVHPRGADLGDASGNTDFIFDVIVGATVTSPTTPVAPAVPAGQVGWYQVAVNGGAAALVAGNLADIRPGNLPIPIGQPASAPRGWIASVVGPASQVNAGSTQTTVLQLTAALIAGRRYRVAVQVLGSQQGASGQPQATFTDSAGLVPVGIVRPFWTGVAIVATTAVPGNGMWTFVATTTGNDTFTLTVGSTAGTCQVGVNAAQISLEDIGAQ